MTTKHIKDETFQRVTKLTMKAIQITKRPVRETEVLNLLILKGLSTITDEDLEQLGKK